MLYPLFRFLKLSVFWIEYLILTTAMYLLAFLPPAWLESFYPQWFHHWCRVFVRALGVDLRPLQQNRKPLPKQYLLIGNHPSAFEDIGIPALFDVRSLAKDGVRDWAVWGRISEAAGTLFVTRESRDSRRDAFEQIIRELNRGHNVALYPEGGCKGRRIAPFRYGVFDISLQTGIPIVPVFLHYEAQETFEWREGQTVLDKVWHYLTTPNNRANYYIFDALYPSDFNSKEAYCQHAQELYLKWQARYLD